MSEEIKVERVTINLLGKRVELTVEQAKELHRELCLLFPSLITPIWVQPQPYQPYIPPWRPYEITCGTPVNFQ